MERNEIHGSEPEKDTVIDFTPFLGTWVNSNEKTRWIKRFSMGQRDGRILMRVHAAEGADWGETEVTPFVDNIGEKAFCARYDRGSVRSLLAGNMNKGLWVIAAFHEFLHGDRPNFLCREFYFQAD